MEAGERDGNQKGFAKISFWLVGGWGPEAAVPHHAAPRGAAA